MIPLSDRYEQGVGYKRNASEKSRLYDPRYDDMGELSPSIMEGLTEVDTPYPNEPGTYNPNYSYRTPKPMIQRSFNALIESSGFKEAASRQGSSGLTYQEMLDSIREDETSFDILRFGGEYNLGRESFTGTNITQKFDQGWGVGGPGETKFGTGELWGRGYRGKETTLQGYMDETLGRIESVYGAQQSLSYQQDVHHQGLGAFTRQGVGPEQAPGVNTAQQLAVRGR